MFLHRISVLTHQKSQQIRHSKKLVYQKFKIIWTCIYLQKEGISKHSRKKIMQLLWTVVTDLLKKCWTLNWTWYWYWLWSFHTLNIPELYSRFDEYLAIWADDKFNTLLVCNIIRFSLSCLWGSKFLTNLVAPECWEVLALRYWL